MKKGNKFQIILTVVAVLLFIIASIYSKDEEKVTEENTPIEQIEENTEEILDETEDSFDFEEEIEEFDESLLSISELTQEERVIAYVRENGELPDYYITKAEARKLGWQGKYRDLCDAAPGKAIGGDHFGNFERLLPTKKGRKYTEADINYNCGKRMEDRLVFSNDGLIFTTKDHYNTFEEH